MPGLITLVSRMLLLMCAWVGLSAHAMTAAELKTFADADNSARIDMIQQWVAHGDAEAATVLKFFYDGELALGASGQVVRTTAAATSDPLSGKVLPPEPDAEKLTINNRVRVAVESALAGLQLASPDARVRLAAARELQNRADESQLPLLEARIKVETDKQVRTSLILTRATLSLQNENAQVRLAAARTLGESPAPDSKMLIEERLKAEGESDPAVRAALQDSLKAIDQMLFTGEMLGYLFSGISLGSILLLVALGLAITYGLLGIINMAHGEMLMIGAYTAYGVQTLFRLYAPGALDWYVIVALPAAFLVAALVGMALERLVIRWLYGRPLETLLATWGISLFLIQLVRMLFGAQNVEVSNPAWLSGGVPVMANLVLPYNRLAIIAFAALVLIGVWILLTKTRLGLFIRATTQNRAMASCVGVTTWKVDTMAFGLGSGIAGLAGVALSQIGNVGPELGQGYIIDSFMVVVTGGVGQLAGTVYASMGLGVINKFLEANIGAVLAKILVLVVIILFIQKRPQGLFALKGRFVDQ